MSIESDLARYRAALHAMQTGVGYMMNYDPAETSPKHLRAGINSAMLELGFLHKALIEKGVFTEEEFAAGLAEFAEKERDSYVEKLKGYLGSGAEIKLV